MPLVEGLGYVLPTKYSGIQFRSRIEARWAVFLDLVNLKYQYEPEGYNLGGLKYLPDFFIPDVNVFLEIKAARPTDEETEKAHRLAVFTGKHVFIASDPPTHPEEWQTDGMFKHFSDQGWDNGHWWCQCKKCGRLDIQFAGLANRIDCQCFDRNKDDYNGHESELLMCAYGVAGKYQFPFDGGLRQGGAHR